MKIKIVPLLSLPKDQVEYYWQSLYMEGTLEKRMCDLINPTWSDVKDMIVRMGRSMYMIQNQDNDLVAEFMLENFTGNAAQVHFSMAPKLSLGQMLQIGTEVSDLVTKGMTLYGLTPVTNRPACLFVLKTGFKKLGILPEGIRDRGEVVDAMITVKRR